MPLDPAAIAAIGTIVSGFGNLIGKVNDQYLKMEFMEKHIAFLTKFQELQTAYAELTEENRTLRREAESLTEKLREKGKVKPHDGVYWLERENGKYDYTPLCPICYVKDEKVSFLKHQIGAKWFCYLHEETTFNVMSHLGTERS